MTPKDMEELGGKALGAEDLNLLRKDFPALPRGLEEVLSKWPLVGLKFSLDDEADKSEMGAEIQWMTPEQMLSEARDVFPGIIAVKRGYIPVGMCLEGSGDSYFYRAKDGAIVRVPHDAGTEEELDEGQIEVVTKSVKDLIDKAEVEGP